jgi:hypothetical protein
LLASFNGLPDAFATLAPFSLAGLSEEMTFLAGFESEDPLTADLGVFVFLPWAGVGPSVVESAGVLDFLALTGAASSVAVCTMSDENYWKFDDYIYTFARLGGSS